MAKKSKKNVNEIEIKTDKDSNNCTICYIILSFVVLALAFTSYQLYSKLLAVPEMPKLDLNTWWGSGLPKNQDTSIRPYRVLYTEAMQENMSRKFNNYRSMNRIKSLNESFSYGVHSDTLAQTFVYWQFQYKNRDRVRYLNKFDHYKTNVQGLDIHFIRAKPQKPTVKVLPLLLIHGWPSSVKEFYEMIPLLTTEKPGHNFVFEIIAPSLPGFVFSSGTVKPGLSTVHISIILRKLMERLGFRQFYVHGGDIGHIIGSHMATIFPGQVLGFHTSFPVNLSKLGHVASAIASKLPRFLTNDLAEKTYSLDEKFSRFLEETGYLHLQSTKPDTIGIALQDSPIGLCAYIIDRISIFSDLDNKYLPDGGLSVYNTTDLLDNVMLYWISGSITTSIRLFKENIRNMDLEESISSIPTFVPTWGLRPKRELVHHPDVILRWKYPNLIGTSHLSKGGHFAAFENPEEVSADIFKAVKNFLTFSKRK